MQSMPALTGWAIRDFRKDLGLTKPQLADRLGSKLRTIEDWEAERRTPPEILRMAIAAMIKGLEPWMHPDESFPSDDQEAEEESDPPRKVYWVGEQWCVTDFGVETIREHEYYINAEELGRLTEGGRDGEPMAEVYRHVSSKTWVNHDDFAAAFALALTIHEGRYPKLPEGALLNAIAHARRRRFMSQVHRQIDHARPKEERTSFGHTIDDMKKASRAADLQSVKRPFSQIPDPDPRKRDLG